MSELMRAAVVERYGGPEVIELREVARPTPKAGEILVRVHAASINDWDWGLMQGAPFINRLFNGLSAPKRRKIFGCDVAGCVEAVGAGVRTFQPGDDVYGDLCTAGFGAFAEYVAAPETSFAQKPASMNFEQAAAIPQAAMLAMQGLFDVGGLKENQSVLLNGAGGGVGTFALQLAKLHGAEVTAVDSAPKLAMLTALGADHVIDYAREDFTKLGRRYDLILDAKTSRSPFAHARALKPGGTYATVGGDFARILEMLAFAPLIAGKRLRVVALKANKDLAAMNALFEAGNIRPIIDEPYRFTDIAEAFRLFAGAGHKGKIVLTMA